MTKFVCTLMCYMLAFVCKAQTADTLICDVPDRDTVNISELPADVYTIMVYDGRQWLNAKLLKQ